MMLPEDARTELDDPTLATDLPEDVLAERDAELQALQEEPANDAERPAGIDDLKAVYDGA